MAMQHHTYTRLIGFLKITLPLVALGVLGTVFLITSDDGFNPGFAFSKSEFTELGAGNFLDNAQINGTTANGDAFSLLARRIEPETLKLDIINATDLTSHFDFASGESVVIISDFAIINNIDQLLIFPQGADITTNDGYSGTLETLTADLVSGAVSGQSLEADGPLGHISAEFFQISDVTPENDENRVLTFNKSVRVTLNIAE